MIERDMIDAVRHRWRLVLGAVAVALALVAVWTLTSPRVYSSTSKLLFDSFQADPVAKGDSSSSAMATMLGTQTDIIRSSLVASQVVRDLKLDQDPATIAKWKQATGGRQSLDSWLGDGLLNSLGVWQSKNTNVLNLTYSGSDPEFAAKAANGFANAFVAIQLRLRTEPAKVYSDWFRDRTRDVRQRLEAAQARKTRFEREHGLIGGEKLDVEMSHLSELSSQLAVAEAAAADLNSRAASGNGVPAEVESSGLVAGLRASAAAKSAEVRQLQTTLGPNHPSLISSTAALDAINAKLGDAIAYATRSVRVASDAANRREGDLRARLSVQRDRVLKLSGTQDRLAVLQRDVDAAKLAYDSVIQRLNATRLQSEIPQASVSLLDRANPSFYPVSPNVSLRFLLALVLGLTIGVGLVVLVEWLAPRVRSSAGLQYGTGLPTLVEFERPRRLLAYQPVGVDR